MNNNLGQQRWSDSADIPLDDDVYEGFELTQKAADGTITSGFFQAILGTPVDQVKLEAEQAMSELGQSLVTMKSVGLGRLRKNDSELAGTLQSPFKWESL